jgi:hypothetical protein
MKLLKAANEKTDRGREPVHVRTTDDPSAALMPIGFKSSNLAAELCKRFLLFQVAVFQYYVSG